VLDAFDSTNRGNTVVVFLFEQGTSVPLVEKIAPMRARSCHNARSRTFATLRTSRRRG
jgi:hypothetical protein